MLLLVAALGLQHTGVPLLLGLTYLAAAAAVRPTGPLWGPGWVLMAVGLTEGLLVPGGRPADSFELAQLLVLAAGLGPRLATGMVLLGVRVETLSVALALVSAGALSLAEARRVPGIAGNVWPYAGLLAVWELAEVTHAAAWDAADLTRSASVTTSAPSRRRCCFR